MVENITVSTVGDLTESQIKFLVNKIKKQISDNDIRETFNHNHVYFSESYTWLLEEPVTNVVLQYVNFVGENDDVNVDDPEEFEEYNNELDEFIYDFIDYVAWDELKEYVISKLEKFGLIDNVDFS